jgi:hypothetical protein
MPWRRILLKGLILPQLVKKVPTPYGIRMNITLFTKASYLFVFGDRGAESSTFHSTSLGPFLILFS